MGKTKNDLLVVLLSHLIFNEKESEDLYGGVQRPEIGNEKRWENERGLMSARLGVIAVIVVAVLELVG